MPRFGLGFMPAGNRFHAFFNDGLGQNGLRLLYRPPASSLVREGNFLNICWHVFELVFQFDLFGLGYTFCDAWWPKDLSSNVAAFGPSVTFDGISKGCSHLKICFGRRSRNFTSF